MRIFADDTHGDEHIALTKGNLGGDLGGDEPVLARVHNLNPLEDVLGISDGHSSDIQGAMRVIAQAGRGVVVLLRDTSMKMVTEGEVSPQTLRQYGLGAQILAALGLTKITLVTNSAAPRVVALEAYGLTIAGTKPITE
jgi:3,4-dihydroxy 2-butanone 4-phosphate synthase/GTP cyclohydrolase II